MFILDPSNSIRTNYEPNRDEIQTVLSYLDILYPNGEPINPVALVDEDRYPTYKPEVNKFFDLVSLWCLEYDSVYTYQMTCDPQKVATANWKEIKQMLTCLARAERLSIYNNARAIESGRVRQILLRMKQLVG